VSLCIGYLVPATCPLQGLADVSLHYAEKASFVQHDPYDLERGRGIYLFRKSEESSIKATKSIIIAVMLNELFAK